MMLRPTLYSAQWLLPVAAPPLCNGAMLVDAHGTIERVAPFADFDLSDEVAHVDLGAAVILPGLINVHAHPELSVFRSLLDDLPFHQWIPTLMRCKRAAALGADDYEAAARWTCAESLRAGITTMGATEDSGAAVTALRDAGMRGLVYLEVFGPSPDQADEAMRTLQAKVERCAADASERVRVGVSPHAPYSVSDTLFARVADYAISERLPVATHAAEAEAEELLVRDGAGAFAAGLRTRGIATAPRGASTIDMLVRTGLMDCAPLLIHAVRVSDNDLNMIADHGASIAHCPVANARLGHGIAPVVEALEKGIRVAIGTDSVASNNCIDLLEEAHIAQVVQRARLQSAGALDSTQLLRMCTIDAARILGVDRTVGTLEAGKRADFCAVSLSGVHTVPVAAVLDTLFHAARGADVVLTVVDGVPLFDSGRFSTLDVASLLPVVAAIGQRLYDARQDA